jgi:hypothetical protein
VVKLPSPYPRWPTHSAEVNTQAPEKLVLEDAYPKVSLP